MKWLAGIAPLWVWAVFGLVLLVLLILAGLFVLLRRARVQELDTEGGEGSARALEGEVHASRLQWLHLRMSFLRAMRSLREHVAGRSYRYSVPWLLLMGEEGSGKTTLLDNTGMNRSWYAANPRIEGHDELAWGFFDRGILLDAPGSFVLRKDGLSSDEHGWNGVLKLLQRHRARRPLDGIVLTLPCRDLLDDSLSASASIQHKATILFEKLWEAERALGMRLPVYVLVTQCDRIPGFQSFAQSLPEDRQENIFGWSNPYHLETAFSTAWVDEAFITMQEELQQVQTELFVAPKQIADPDHLFLFPGAFWRLREPLRIYLGRIFKETGYRESFFFRGIYFCGDLAGATSEAGPDSALALWMPDPAMPSDAATESLPALSPQPAPVFLRHLFENRIFPEFGVARPNSRAFLSHNRITLASQIAAVAAAVILTLGTAFSYHRLQNENQHVVLPFLQEIATDRDRVQRITALPARLADSSAINHNEYDLLSGMAELTGIDFSSWFLPTSHFSSIRRQINLAMVPAFEQLVFKTVRFRLEHKAIRIIAGAAASSSATTAGDADDTAADPAEGETPLTIEQTAEYHSLKQYGDQLRHLQNAIDIYEKMRKPGIWVSPEDFEKLVVYLGGHPLPEGFDYENNQEFRNALAQASGTQYVCAPNLQQQATRRMRDLAAQLYDRWYGHNVLLDDAAVIEQQTAAVLDHSGGAQQGPDLSTLQQAITQLQGDLTQPGLAEIVQGQFRLTDGPVIKAALQPSCYLNSNAAAYAAQDGQSAFGHLQQNLLDQSTSLTGPIFDASSGLLQLSPGVQQLQAGIAQMQKLPFMSSPTDANLTATIPAGMQLLWNTADLQQALSLQTAYDGFTQTSLAGTPWRMHDALRTLALRQLQHTMLHLVGEAQQFTPISGNPQEVSMQQDLVPGIQGFQAAQPSLEKLQALMRRWGQYGAMAKLQSITRSQALQLLQLLDEKFNEQAPYVIRDGDFAWWNGQAPVAMAAFGVQSPDALADYLAFQQSRIKSFADLAQPLVSALGGSSADLDRNHARLLTKWNSIVRASNQAAGKNPNSSLARLNAFIQTGMDQITPAHDCALPASSPDRADYFLQIRDQLQQQLRERCLDVALGSAWSSYTQLEEFFNQHLAGRFPFVAANAVDSTPGADPAALRQFLQMVAQSGASARGALQQTRQFGASREAALQFLQQAGQLQTFFSAFMKPGVPSPVFDVTPTFRVNRERERGGDRIITWSLHIAGQTAQQGPAPASLRWVYGQPVAIELRWAMNSPVVPAPTAGAHVAVSGHSASFNYNDAWSLLRLLRRFRAPAADFTGLSDASPVTLALPVGTMTTSGAASQPALVFVRLQVSQAGQKAPLPLPDFPTHAPQLVRPQGEE